MSHIVRAALIGLLLPTAAFADTSAHVSFLEGSATRNTGDKSAALAVGLEVRPGDHVTTAENSRLELILEDGSVIRLGPRSELDVTDLRFDAESRTLTAKLKLALGQIWSHVEHLAPSGTYEVTTERAVAGVRGTEFRVDTADAEGSVEVYKGRVAVQSGALAFTGEGEGEPGSAITKLSAAGVHAVMVEPGKHLHLAADGMRLYRQRPEPDAFGKFVRTRELPKREAFFKDGNREERERDHERRRRERRQERLERLRWRH